MDTGTRRPPRSSTFANVMSAGAMLVALTALVTGTATSKTGPNCCSQPAKNSVGTKQVKPDALKEQDIAAAAVKAKELAEKAVTERKLQEAAVTAGKLAGNSVTAPKIAADAVGTSEIANSLPAVGVTSDFTSPIDENDAYEMAFTLETYDTAAMHDDTPEDEIVVPTDGVYLFVGTTEWSSSAADIGTRAISLIVDGASKYASSVFFDEISQPWSTALVLEAGDVVQLRVINQAQGPGAGDGDTSHTSHMNMIWIAPGPA